MGLSGTIEEGQEPPDFLVRVGDRQIGVEITEYHQPAHSGNRFKRSQVEAEWAKLRESVVDYRRDHDGLENLSVLLTFTDLSVPGRKHHDEFIRAVHVEVSNVRVSSWRCPCGPLPMRLPKGEGR